MATPPATDALPGGVSAESRDEDGGEEDGEEKEDGGEPELDVGDGGALGARFSAKHRSAPGGGACTLRPAHEDRMKHATDAGLRHSAHPLP